MYEPRQGISESKPPFASCGAALIGDETPMRAARNPRRSESRIPELP